MVHKICLVVNTIRIDVIISNPSKMITQVTALPRHTDDNIYLVFPALEQDIVVREAL